MRNPVVLAGRVRGSAAGKIAVRLDAIRAFGVWGRGQGRAGVNLVGRTGIGMG